MLRTLMTMLPLAKIGSAIFFYQFPGGTQFPVCEKIGTYDDNGGLPPPKVVNKEEERGKNYTAT